MCIVAIYGKRFCRPHSTWREFRSTILPESNLRLDSCKEIQFHCSVYLFNLNGWGKTQVLCTHASFSSRKHLLLQNFQTPISVLVEACKKSTCLIAIFASVQPRAWCVLHFYVEIVLLYLSIGRSYHCRLLLLNNKFGKTFWIYLLVCNFSSELV